MKNIKLYNVRFPFWMLMLFPTTWLVVIPGNFVIDSLVLIAAMFAVKLASKKDFWKSSFWTSSSIPYSLPTGRKRFLEQICRHLPKSLQSG